MNYQLMAHEIVQIAEVKKGLDIRYACDLVPERPPAYTQRESVDKHDLAFVWPTQGQKARPWYSCQPWLKLQGVNYETH